MPKSFFRRFSKTIFIIANVVVAILFLAGCYAKYFNPAHWWFIGILTLSAFYLFAVLFIFLLFWLFVKPRYALIFILTIALAWNPLQKIVPFRKSVDFALQPKQGQLRVMSWNVAQFDILDNKKSPRIKNEMIDLINKYQPGIACFQEMVAGDTTVDLNNWYYHKYAFYPLKDFDSSLGYPNHFYSYNKKEDFMNQQHFGLIIFSKYPIINKKTVGFYPYDYNSIFQYADIVKGNDTIRVFNIHLQSLKFTKSNLQYIDNPTIDSKTDLKKSKNVISKLKSGFLKRQTQALRINDEISKSPYRVIVCGDFNDVPNSYAYETIGEGLKNAFEEKGAGIDRTFSGISPTLRIDNIFSDKTIRTVQYTRIRKRLSDHFPITADFDLTAK